MASRLALPILLLLFGLASASAALLLFLPEEQLRADLRLPVADSRDTEGEEEAATEAETDPTGDAEPGDEAIELASLSIPATIPEGTKFVVSLGLFTTEESATQRADELGPRGPAQGVQAVLDTNGRKWFMSMLGPLENLREANRIVMFVRSRHGAYPTIHIAPAPPKE